MTTSANGINHSKEQSSLKHGAWNASLHIANAQRSTAQWNVRVHMLHIQIHTYSSASFPWASPQQPSPHSRSQSPSGGHSQQPAGCAVGPCGSSLKGWWPPCCHFHAKKQTRTNTNRNEDHFYFTHLMFKSNLVSTNVWFRVRFTRDYHIQHMTDLRKSNISKWNEL